MKSAAAAELAGSASAIRAAYREAWPTTHHVGHAQSAFRAAPGTWPSGIAMAPAIPPRARYPNLANTVNTFDGGKAFVCRNSG
jgi:hypothetical protein